MQKPRIGNRTNVKPSIRERGAKTSTEPAASRADDRESRVIVGTSGWRYARWRGDFYPAGLAQRRELEYLAERMPSVEINGSFYSLQRPSSYRDWAAQTPAGFVFGVKGGRFITHLKGLRDPETPLANFFASGVLVLGEKLGPILWQLPERLAFDAELLDAFLSLLPRTTTDAAQLATRHDDRVKNVEIPESPAARVIRHAIEPRHESFGSPEALTLLRRHDVALVQADSAGRWPMFRESTADFSYLRLHGHTRLYYGGYGRERLEKWADEARELAASGHPHDVYVYFDNDADGRAPWDAQLLAELVSGGVGAADSLVR